MNFKTFFSPALILSLGTFGSYILGVVRDIFFARSYGATQITDTYFSAFLIPDILLMICVSSALLGIAIPLFMQARERNNDYGYKLYGVFFTSIQTIFIFISVIGIIFTPEIFSFIDSQRYAENPELITNLARIFFASNLLFGISNFLGSFVMAHKHFISTALAPLFYNIGITLGIIFFAESYGIYAAAFGALIGAFAHLFSRAFEYFYHSDRFKISYNWKSPQLKELFSSMILRWITVAALPLIFWSFSKYASFTQEGLYTIFFYARNLESAPVMIFGVAIATSVFPLLSQNFAEKNIDKLLFIFWNAFYKILFWTIPMAIGIFFLGDLLLGQIYDLTDDFEKMIWIKNILIIIAFAIPFEALTSLFARTFNAMGDTKTPLRIAIISLCTTFSILAFLYFSKIFSPSSSIAIAYISGFIISVFSASYFLFSLDLLKKNKKITLFPFVSIARKGFILSFIGSFLMGIIFYVLQNSTQYSYIRENNLSFLFEQLLFIPLSGIIIYFIFITLFWKKNLLRNIKRML